MTIKIEKKTFFFKKVINSLFMWFDSDVESGDKVKSEKVNWIRSIPFILLHLLCFFVILVGWSPIALIFAALVYFIQMFVIIGFYHRYFSHKSFKTSRIVQFLSALIGGCAIQKGALWWASNHRHHHKYSDTPHDIHSPSIKGFWWSHMGWIMADKYFNTNYKLISDFAKFPELRWLNRFDVMIPIFTGTSIFCLGYLLNIIIPTLGTSGGQLLIWTYFIPTVLSLHGTFFVNSLAHVWGTQRFKTTDTSRNNFFISMVTLGEGWHNNHHRYQASARSGFYWWEIDITFYILKVLSWFGIIWDLKKVPESIYIEAKENMILTRMSQTIKK